MTVPMLPQGERRRSVVGTVAGTVAAVLVLALLWVLVLRPLVRAVTWIMVVIALLLVAGRFMLLRRLPEGRGGSGPVGDVRRLWLASTSGVTWVLRTAYGVAGLVLLAGWLVTHRRGVLRGGRRLVRRGRG